MAQKEGFWRSLYQGLASLKLTVFVFLTLAICSLVGTLLPQGLAPHEMEKQYSPGMLWFIEALGLNDLYRTGWFRLLLLLLCINLIVCTIERLPKTLKLLQRRDEHISPEKLLKFNYSREISTRMPWEEAMSRVNRVVSEGFAALEPLDNPAGFSALAEKGRWSPLMVYIVHLSVLVVLFGALMGSLFGFKGVMNISEGEASDEVLSYKGDKQIVLPFQVRCDKFDVSFYDTGAPKEYRSDLAIIEKGQEVHKQSIRVNDPLTYQGVTFYQASYGSTLKLADVELLDRNSGKSYKMTLPFRETRPIPGTRDQVQIMDYQQDLSRFGPAVAVMISKEGQQEPEGSWIVVNMPDFHGNRVGSYQIKVTRLEKSQYTGLQVKRDPGVWMVWLGFTAMVIGIGMTFYTSHRKIWIWAAPTDGSSKIIIAGRANKNPLAFEQEFNELCQQLQDDLKSSDAMDKKNKKRGK